MSSINEETHPLICRDLNGNIPLSEAFRPVETNIFITDTHGEQWRQITAMGYVRVKDTYFWPAHPNDANNWLGRKAPTVEEIVEDRKRFKN